MEHIKKLLDKRLQQSGLAKDVKTALVIEEFEQLIKEYFGLNIAKKINPLYIKNKILTVACLSSVIVQEFGFKRAEIIRKINQKFGETVIEDIKFTL